MFQPLPPCALHSLWPSCVITHVFFPEGTKKLTNKATLWYVPLSLKNVDKVLEVPPVVVRRPPPPLLSGGRWRRPGHRLHRHPRRPAAGVGCPADQQEMAVVGGVPVWNVREAWPRAGGCPSWRTLPRAPDPGSGGGRPVSGDGSFSLGVRTPRLPDPGQPLPAVVPEETGAKTSLFQPPHPPLAPAGACHCPRFCGRDFAATEASLCGGGPLHLGYFWAHRGRPAVGRLLEGERCAREGFGSFPGVAPCLPL